MREIRDLNELTAMVLDSILKDQEVLRSRVASYKPTSSALELLLRAKIANAYRTTVMEAPRFFLEYSPVPLPEDAVNFKSFESGNNTLTMCVSITETGDDRPNATRQFVTYRWHVAPRVA